MGGGSSTPDAPAASATVVPAFAAKVTACATGDAPETGLQGQVPAALRASGFKGFNCNLSLVGQLQGEGGNWSTATFSDKAGRRCAYYSTAAPFSRTGVPTGRLIPGVPVIDITDPTKPVRITSLTSPAMLDPWESLRVHAGRQLLMADNGQNGGGGPEVDVYDLSGDCGSPQLMASAALSYNTGDPTAPTKPIIGHEGNVSPDGLTYYVGDLRQGKYHAVDITNPTRPKLIATYDIQALSPIGKVPHGLSISTDGNRAYVAAIGGLPSVSISDLTNPNFANNGFIVLDTSEIQARKPNAQFRAISSVAFKDGTVAQHTIEAKIGGKPYMVMVDEGGSAGLADPTNAKVACAAGMSPFPMARIYDMSDETAPKVVSKFGLETHDPKNCDAVLQDITGLSTFTYGSHYCSVDSRENATAMACSYFNSGVRVFDIRNPATPKEIAYFNPKSSPTAVLGSNHSLRNQWKPGSPDWCASRLDFDKARGQLTTMCQDNGLLVMKFTNGTWPFAETVTSTTQN